MTTTLQVSVEPPVCRNTGGFVYIPQSPKSSRLLPPQQQIGRGSQFREPLSPDIPLCMTYSYYRGSNQIRPMQRSGSRVPLSERQRSGRPGFRDRCRDFWSGGLFWNGPEFWGKRPFRGNREFWGNRASRSKTSRIWPLLEQSPLDRPYWPA